MKIVNARSFARAGFLGNPSDGYFGKTVSFTFNRFCVDLKLMESERLAFTPGQVDDASFANPRDLVRDLRLYGYYGGIRMLKAVSKLFFEYCFDHGIELEAVNFTASYKINIPRLVGLSGSSAICSAMLKALMEFYGVEIPLEVCPTICLEAERDELGIACGLQDRVIQMYNGMVYMDFERTLVESTGHGRYERLAPPPLNLYVAFDPNRAEESGKAHRKVKRLFQEKNRDVMSAMDEFADIAREGRDILADPEACSGAAGRKRLAELVNANFDLRDRVFNVASENRNMVMVARAAGASAKFAGSGGAIVGTYEDDGQFALLKERLAAIGCTTFRPVIATAADERAEITANGWRTS